MMCADSAFEYSCNSTWDLARCIFFHTNLESLYFYLRNWTFRCIFVQRDMLATNDSSKVGWTIKGPHSRPRHAKLEKGQAKPVVDIWCHQVGTVLFLNRVEIMTCPCESITGTEFPEQGFPGIKYTGGGGRRSSSQVCESTNSMASQNCDWIITLSHICIFLENSWIYRSVRLTDKGWRCLAALRQYFAANFWPMLPWNPDLVRNLTQNMEYESMFL